MCQIIFSLCPKKEISRGQYSWYGLNYPKKNEERENKAAGNLKDGALLTEYVLTEDSWMAGPLDGVEEPDPPVGGYGLPSCMPRYHGFRGNCRSWE